MKYIVAAVLLVAVCQGMSLQSKQNFNKRTGYRNVNQNPRQVTTPYSLKPFTAYTLKTKNSTSDARWTKEQYSNIKEVFLFPGSHYLSDLIHDHYENNWIMDVEDIKDYFEFPECKMDDLKRIMYGVYKATEDPKGTALLSTRYVMKHVFHQKMKCPASIVDMYIVRMMYHGKNQLFYRHENNVYSVLTEMIPKISPELAPYTDDIAMRAVEMLEKNLFNKTLEFLVGFGLRDVAYTSHTLYQGLEDYFKFNMDKSTHYAVYTPSLLDTVRGYMWDVHCSGVEEMMDTHLDMINLFREEFAMIESSELCVKLEDMLREYLDMMMPNMVHDLSGGNLWTLCTSVKEMVRDFMEAMDQYESVLRARDISQLENLVRDELDDSDWTILSEAVMRLGFYMNHTR